MYYESKHAYEVGIKGRA